MRAEDKLRKLESGLRLNREAGVGRRHVRTCHIVQNEWYEVVYVETSLLMILIVV